MRWFQLLFQGRGVDGREGKRGPEHGVEVSPTEKRAPDTVDSPSQSAAAGATPSNDGTVTIILSIIGLLSVSWSKAIVGDMSNKFE